MAQRKSRVIPWRRRQIIVNNYYDEYCKIEYEGELYHSKEEVDAAIALLMLHYQDFQNVIPKKPKISSPKVDNDAANAIPNCSRNPPNENKNENEQQNRPSTSKNSEHSKRKSRNEEQEVNRNNNNSNRINRSNKRKERTSLLTSCRNILKEFLEQNGFQ